MLLETLYVLLLLVVGIGLAVNFAGGFFSGLCLTVFFVIAGVLGLYSAVHWFAQTDQRDERFLPTLGFLFCAIVCSGIILI